MATVVYKLKRFPGKYKGYKPTGFEKYQREKRLAELERVLVRPAKRSWFPPQLGALLGLACFYYAVVGLVVLCG